MYNIFKTSIVGCFSMIPKVFEDFRGVSIKPYHIDSFKKMGIDHGFEEDLMVISHKGVLRGLHFQKPPHEQAKLIWCATGCIFDVAVDLREGSATYGQYAVFYIDARNHNMAYIPAGFAHGYQVLEDNTTVCYKMSSMYAPEYESGIRYDSLAIQWPLKDPIVSKKDEVLPNFNMIYK